MPISGNFETVQPSRQAITILTGDVYGRTTLIAGVGTADEPHAYLIDQPPDVLLPPHFHTNDQFQVVVAGSGMLGRAHKLEPITVHFARGKTTYGPIASGPKGLSYLTLLQQLERGAHYLSNPNTRVDHAAVKFQITSDPVTPSGGDVLAARVSTSQEVLIAPDANGLAVCLSRLPPSTPFVAPLPDPLAGRFYVVVGGTVVMGSEALPLWSCIWVSADEPPVLLAAGPAGAELLTLQFPCYGTCNTQQFVQADQADQSATADISS